MSRDRLHRVWLISSNNRNNSSANPQDSLVFLLLTLRYRKLSKEVVARVDKRKAETAQAKAATTAGAQQRGIA
jgi:hypothetical protein